MRESSPCRYQWIGLSEDVDTYINLKKIYEENKASIVSTEPHLEKIEYTDSQDKLFPKIRTESCEDD